MFSVIFEVHPAEGKKDEYLAHAKELKPILEGIDGFIDNERFESRLRPGWVLSHSTWRDEKSLIRWRTETKHHFVQEKGRFGVFSDYHLRVGQIIADDAPPAGMAVREQRLDTTESGDAKACSLIEFSPDDKVDLPKDAQQLLSAIALDQNDQRLVGHDIFESIYNPGKVAVLASWREESDAKSFRATSPSGAKNVRQRAVRIIRDYGMFDRHETPQYYAEVKRNAA